jgi:hypothetical protein
MEHNKLIVNENTCWCEFCKVNIKPKTRYLCLYKRAWRSPSVRINICLNCLKEIVKSFKKDDDKECGLIKLRVLANSISKDEK